MQLQDNLELSCNCRSAPAVGIELDGSLGEAVHESLRKREVDKLQNRWAAL